MPNGAGLVILFLVAGAVLLVVLVGLLVRGASNPPRRTAAYAVARGLPCDPGDADLPFEAWRLERPGGVGLAVWECRAGDADGPTVVFVHGWGQSRIDMLGRIHPWREAASGLVLYDLRGHGESDGPSPLGHGEDEDLVALLEALGPRRFVLVGFSMGAVIAVLAGADARVRDRVAGVAAYGVFTDFHASLVGRLRAARLPARPITDLAMFWFRLRGIRHRSVVAAAGALACPLLVIHGEIDRVVSPEHAETLAAAAPDAVLHRAAGASHLDAHIIDAAGHDRVVRGFLARLTTPPSGRRVRP